MSATDTSPLRSTYEPIAWNFKLLAQHELDGFGGMGEGMAVQVAPDGRRIIWEIAVVEGTRRGEPIVEPVFRFRPREGGLGRFSASGMIPAIVDVLRQRGEDLADGLFAVGEDAA